MPDAIIAAVIIAVVGPSVLFILGRIFNKPKNDVDLIASMQEALDKAQSLANKAIDDLHKEKELSAKERKERSEEREQEKKERAEEYRKWEERIRQVELRTTGPFRIILLFGTNPLEVKEARIELVEAGDSKL